MTPSPHPVSSEHNEQCAYFDWCRLSEGRYPELGWAFAVPNGAKLPYRKSPSGQRYSPQAAVLLKEGLRPGVADIFIPCARGYYHGLFIEMKWGRNKPTPEQAQFLFDMNTRGYLAVVCYGADEAILITQSYLDLRQSECLDAAKLFQATRS